MTKHAFDFNTDPHQLSDEELQERIRRRKDFIDCVIDLVNTGEATDIPDDLDYISPKMFIDFMKIANKRREAMETLGTDIEDLHNKRISYKHLGEMGLRHSDMFMPTPEELLLHFIDLLDCRMTLSAREYCNRLYKVA